MRTILKIGGSVLEPAPSPALLAAVAARVEAGEELVIVHGGGKALTALLARLGVATRFERGLRVTDEATLRAAVMTLAGEVNKGLVARLNQAGVRAVGLTGLDGASITARVEDPALGLVGVVTGENPALLLALLDGGFTPVLAPLAGDGAGGALNVNADLFAAACARATRAERVFFVTDVAGVLDGAGEVIAEIEMGALEGMVAEGTIGGGMLPKLSACREALDAGAQWVQIAGVEALERGRGGGTRIWRKTK